MTRLSLSKTHLNRTSGKKNLPDFYLFFISSLIDKNKQPRAIFHHYSLSVIQISLFFVKRKMFAKCFVSNIPLNYPFSFPLKSNRERFRWKRTIDPHLREIFLVKIRSSQRTGHVKGHASSSLAEEIFLPARLVGMQIRLEKKRNALSLSARTSREQK